MKIIRFKDWKTVYKIYSLLLILIIPIVLLIVFYILPSVKSKLYEERKEAVKKSVEMAYNLVNKTEALVSRGQLSVEQAKAQAKYFVKSLKNSYNDYFWIQDTNYIMIMHPIRPSMDGTCRKYDRDPTGKYFSMEFQKVAMNEGSGFVNYMWYKPGTDKSYPKISFVKLYSKWGWIIGGGVYVEDVEAEISALLNKLLIAIVVILIIVLILAYIISEKLSKPLFTLKKLENNTDSIYFKDLEGRYTKVSSVFSDSYKMNPKEILGKTDFDLFGSNYANVSFEDEREIIKTGNPLLGKEEQIELLNGNIKWISTSKMPLLNDNGGIIGTFGISRDITKLKENEEEIKKILQFEKTISKISAIFLKYGAEKFEYALAVILQELGIMFRAERSYVYFQKPGDENEFDKKEEYYADANEVPVQFELKKFKSWSRELNNQQTIFWFRDSGIENPEESETDYINTNRLLLVILIPVINHNKLSGFTGFECRSKENVWLYKYESLFKILSEILSYAYSNYLSEKFRLEAEYELMTMIRAINQSPSVIMILDNKCAIYYVNPRFSELTGYTFEEAKRKVPAFLNPDENKEFNKELFWKLMESGKSWEERFQEVSKSGKVFWESIIVSPVRNNKNEITNLIAIVEDITEKILIDSRKAVSQKLESIGQLAAGVAHEINTPMQFIGDNTRFLKDTLTTLLNYLTDIENIPESHPSLVLPQFKPYLKELNTKFDLDYLLQELPLSIEQTEEGVKRVSGLVMAMKDFAHPSTKEKAFSDINHGIKVTAEISRNEWKYIADLELKLSPTLPLVYCLQDELNQVILNMIINSTQAIEEKQGKGSAGKGNITIETLCEDSFAVIIISDTGKGIEESIINKIYDPFFTTKEVGKGTGQGLAIVHDLIVNKHGGVINVFSTPGLGTKFVIKIPINVQ